MRPSLIGLLAAVLLLLSGCQLGKHYTRPQLDLPVSLQDSAHADTLHADTLCFADYPWDWLYADTLLQDLIRRTLVYNKDMQMAAARVKELAAMKRIDFANLFPSVNFRGYAEKEADNYGGDAYSPDNQFDLKAVVSWELDLWGKLRWAKDASVAEFVGSIESRRALQMSLVAQVAQAYFELVALDNELAIVRQTVEARRESLHLVRLRYEGGLISEIPFRQAQVELAKTVTLVPDLERKITLKENELSFLTGEYPHGIRRTPSTVDIVLPDNLPVGLPSALLERRPDVRQAEQNLIAATAEVGVAYTSLFPSITLTAHLGAESEELEDILKSPYHLLSGALLQPIFAMGKNRARLKAKKAACERAAYAYEKAVLSALKDAYNAITEFNKIKDIYDTRLRLEQSAKSTLDLAELQYVNGAIGYMDLLDAQRTYFEAQLSLSYAIRDKRITMVNLYKALGGGWE
ncbi:efflux transporter outer membrane subunit [uncultured Bacteroides sp.]|uniref:efflux transporter outer membrane subunit n=1 Tax=uncultured Bacteroides sp. TaxID=162156 RepID=UPI00260DB6C1|nr:efflux transporter outer membrane subunit [uncultured Bacteroides sp.]